MSPAEMISSLQGYYSMTQLYDMWVFDPQYHCMNWDEFLHSLVEKTYWEEREEKQQRYRAAIEANNREEYCKDCNKHIDDCLCEYYDDMRRERERDISTP